MIMFNKMVYLPFTTVHTILIPNAFFLPLRFILAIHAYDGHLKWEKRRI